MLRFLYRKKQSLIEHPPHHSEAFTQLSMCTELSPCNAQNQTSGTQSLLHYPLPVHRAQIPVYTAQNPIHRALSTYRKHLHTPVQYTELKPLAHRAYKNSTQSYTPPSESPFRSKTSTQSLNPGTQSFASARRTVLYPHRSFTKVSSKGFNNRHPPRPSPRNISPVHPV